MRFGRAFAVPLGASGLGWADLGRTVGLGTSRTADLRAGRALGLAVRRGLERGAAPFDRRAALVGFDARAAFLATAGLAGAFGWAFAFDLGFAFGLAFGLAFTLGWAAAGRLTDLAFTAAPVLAFVFGFPRAAGPVLAADFGATLGRDLAAGRAVDRRLVVGLAVAFFRAAIPVLKSALAACPLGRRSIWRRPFGSKPKGEKPHNPLKINELQVKSLTTAGH